MKEKYRNKENEILLKVLCVGVCGTDIQVYVGKNKFMEFPIVPFHEGVGEIVKKGSQVKEFEVGDRVVVEPILSCGKCRPCLIGSAMLAIVCLFRCASRRSG